MLPNPVVHLQPAVAEDGTAGDDPRSGSGSGERMRRRSVSRVSWRPLSQVTPDPNPHPTLVLSPTLTRRPVPSVIGVAFAAHLRVYIKYERNIDCIARRCCLQQGEPAVPRNTGVSGDADCGDGHVRIIHLRSRHHPGDWRLLQ